MLSWKKVSRFAVVMDQDQNRKRDRAYTHPEIGEMLQLASRKMKAVILLFASTGIHFGAVPELRLRNIVKLNEHDDIYQITVYEGSSEEYITFCTPEAAKSISGYLQFRVDAGEPLSEGSPVFRADF